MRGTWAEVDLSAVEHNVGTLCRLIAPAALVAVVKADGYGHGAVEVGRAALAAGAWGLAVALAEEGASLRAARIDAPVLLLSEPPPTSAAEVVAGRLQPAVYTEAGIAALADAVAARWAEVAPADSGPVAGDGSGEEPVPDEPLPVHLKVDTGMHRVGAAPADIVSLAKAVGARPELHLASVWTHCAVADEPDDPFTAEQLERFSTCVADLEGAGIAVPVLTRPTPPPPSPTRPLGSTWSAAASPSTASSPVLRLPAGSTSDRSCGSCPGCHTSRSCRRARP
ncbi:MAG: alanine racemase [Acidimicrobiales bacterium]